MKITLAQIDTTIGDVRGNAKRILEACAKAKQQGADLILLPELVVTGYPPRDLLNIGEFRRTVDAAVDAIVRELPLPAIFGAPRSRSSPGRTLYNTAIVAEPGRIVAEVHKALLPTYDVFDERRYFEPCEQNHSRVFEIAGKRIGVVICEDMWNDRLFWGEQRLYDRDPVAEAAEQGAEVIVNISASPFAERKFEVRRAFVAHAAKRWRVPVAYVNAVGGNDGILFDGHSLAFAADGSPVAELPFFEEHVRTIDLEDRITPPAVDVLDVLHRALVMGVRDYARKTGMTKWVLGLSGGVDSALVAAIGCLALGAENGAALAMPSRYSSDHSINDARVLANKLGLPFEVVPIEPAHAAYESMLTFAKDDPGVAWENVQARIRGATLMAWANRFGSLLLTTGNKSECSVGYCTLYGDMCGGLAVIADLYKTEVYPLCRWLNANKIDNAIPESTLTKPPSAELRPGQRDDQSLPPYDVLDPILENLVDRELGTEETARVTGASRELVRRVAGMLHRAEYKRQQFAPTLKVSPRAWVGRDYPIAMGWRP
jgi:NAD+ synthase (glutamine-hydrolysing)